MGESEVALLRDRPPEEYRRVLQSQHEELRGLARVVDNLVTLLASEDPHIPGVEEFDLVGEARIRLERELSRARRKSVRIELEGDDAVTCTGDREALLLALSNMVSNAVEWAAQDGLVRVDIRGAGERHGGSIRVTDSPLGGARFEVDLPRRARDAAASQA
jgi:two-component system heavy metal sensor histidine kinase CusS